MIRKQRGVNHTNTTHHHHNHHHHHAKKHLTSSHHHPLLNKDEDLTNSTWFNNFGFILFLLMIAVLAYYIYKIGKAYSTAKKVKAVIQLISPHPARVGETLTCRIRFRQNNGALVPSPSDLFNDLKANSIITLMPTHGSESINVAIIKEASTNHNFILGKFSLRKSGSYEVSIRYTYHILKLTSTPPFIFHVFPGPPAYKNIDFGTINPSVLCLTAGVPQPNRISCNDEYGNKCQVEDVDLSKFSFKIFHMGNEMSPDVCEFCLYEDVNSTNSTSGSPVITTGLKLQLTDPGVYVCALGYDSYEVPHNKQGAPKLVVCLSPEEESNLKDIVTFTNIPGLFLYKCSCKVEKLTDKTEEVGPFELIAGVSYSSLCFAKYQMALHVYPDYRFPVNGKTSVAFSWSQFMNNDVETITFLIEDGLRPSLSVELEAEMARALLVVFAHCQGLLLPKLTINFQEKKQRLKSQITPYFHYINWLCPVKYLIVQPGNLIKSSIAASPKNRNDWTLEFIIRYESGIAAGSLPKAHEWLSLLCEEFFGEKGKLFERSAGSKLLHPKAATVSRQPLEYYNFCGKIIAKCIVETLLRGACTRLSGVKFTKSFLAFILGFPIHYKLLETDDPSFFREIMPLLECSVSSLNVYFTTMPSSAPSNANIVNLIPNGSEHKVSDENKEHFLNLLTKHRLIHTVEQEISAIRDGFYDVIDKDYLCDFKKNDLQMLISGGCALKIEDLKEHHRVVGEVIHDTQHNMGLHSTVGRDDKKLLNWFFAAIQNMSEKEHSYLIFFTTGCFTLPTCGFKDLSPKFTINVTGTFNQLPKGNPISNEIILGDHISFEKFERSLLFAIKPESEKIALPQTTVENRLTMYNPLLQLQLDEFSDELNAVSLEFYQENNITETPQGNAGIQPHRNFEAGDAEQGYFAQDPFFNWLREFIHL